MFAELKHDKDTDDWRSNDDLLKLFDDEAQNHFYWPPDDMRRQRLEDLRTRPIILTPTEKATGLTWDFDSLMGAFVNGEYNQLSCEMIDDRMARLNSTRWHILTAASAVGSHLSRRSAGL